MIPPLLLPPAATGNSIRQEGARAVADAISDLPQLRYLDLGSTFTVNARSYCLLAYLFTSVLSWICFRMNDARRMYLSESY